MLLCRSILFALSFFLALKAQAEDTFECPAGARDSGYKVGNVVRWCEVTKEGRLLYHGPVWRWHHNGQQESKENYIYGAADGDFPSWHENGKISSHGMFLEGSKVGPWKYWNEQGQLTSEVVYGETGNQKTEYYSSGAKKAIGTFVSSGKIGSWVYWGPDGKEMAQCEFGNGVFKPPTVDCHIIASELNPKGYSRPIPTSNLNPNGTCSLQISNQGYSFKTPSGWVADKSAGKKEGAPLVFFPVGGRWRGNNSNIYIRAIYKDGASFDAVQKSEIEGFRENVAEYSVLGTKKEQLRSGVAVVTQAITYKAIIETDSPFSIVADNTTTESLSYLNVSNEVVLLAVLTSQSKMSHAASRPAFDSLVRSLRVEAK